MVLAWMTYLVLVSALAAGAAWAAERALRLLGRPTRWAWGAALAVSVSLPALAWLLPRAGDAGAGVPSAALGLPALVAGGAGPAGMTGGDGAVAWAARLDPFLLALWAVSIAVSVGLLLRLGARLRREREAWERARVDGEEVYLAEEAGPAVVGLLRGEVVLPRWIGELEAEVRRAVLLHEREHLRAGDQRLHALGTALVLAAPWNPLLWWQLGRLRLALECDCDARVLARGISAGEYGRSLLRVGARLSGVRWGVAGFAEPKSFLQRRMETMTESRGRWRGPKAAVAAAAAVGMLILACEAVPPVEPEATLDQAEVVEAASAGVADSELQGSADGEGPVPLPFDTPPRLENPVAVREALQAAYPRPLREEGIGGTVGLWLHLDEEGRVVESRIQASSGRSELDVAALAVVDAMSFEPAAHEGRPTEVWVRQNITFEPRAEVAERLDLAALRAASGEAPLVVIDGEPQPRSEPVVLRKGPEGILLSELLKPEEIERIEVVKGEAARALYGERGANGVILITTKRAAAGG